MAISASNSFGTRDKLSVGAQSFSIHRLEQFEKKTGHNNSRKPFSLRNQREKMHHKEDARLVKNEESEAQAKWTQGAAEKEI